MFVKPKSAFDKYVSELSAKSGWLNVFHKRL